MRPGGARLAQRASAPSDTRCAPPVQERSWPREAAPVRQDARVRTRVLLLLASVVVGSAAAGAGAVPRTLRPHVVDGFRVDRYAAGLKHPTAMAFGPDGRLYVTEDQGTLVSLRAGARVPRVALRGLRTPLGLTWLGQRLYVSTEG